MNKEIMGGYWRVEFTSWTPGKGELIQENTTAFESKEQNHPSACDLVVIWSSCNFKQTMKQLLKSHYKLLSERWSYEPKQN